MFCDECTKHSMPVPQQQLNNPVRVCKLCFTMEHCDEVTLVNGNVSKEDADLQVLGIEAAMNDDVSSPDMMKSSLTMNPSTD